MNKIIYIVTSLFALSTFWSCENLLDVDTDSKIILGEDAPTNQSEVGNLVVGCYNGLRKPLDTEWMLTELRSDNSYQYSQSSTNTTNLELNDLDMYRPLTTNVQVYQYWVDVYANIKNANLVLDYLDLVNEDDVRRQFEGEMRFIRAYHYYNLVQLYGPVPLVTKYITTNEAKKINRSPVEDVYAQIIEDLEFGAKDETQIPAKDENGQPVLDENDNPVMETVPGNLPLKYADENLGRITRWSAKMLLAKTYLLMEDYSNAEKLLVDIKDNSGHRLLANYADVFSTIDEYTPETIFAVRFLANAGGQGSPFANRFSPASSGNKYIIGDGSSYNFPSMDLIDNVFEEGDARKDMTISLTYTDKGKLDKRWVAKYFSSVKRKDDAENDWQVLRYSDVLLMLAEIYNETESTTKAAPYILQIRQRAGLDLDKTTLQYSSQSECRTAIEKERRAEFAFENQRFFDLVRTNRLKDVLNTQFFGVPEDPHSERGWYAGYGANGPTFKTIPDTKMLLPIPQKEIDTSTEFILTQNAGY